MCFVVTKSFLLTCCLPIFLMGMRYYFSRKVILHYLDCALHTDMSDIEQYYMKPPGTHPYFGQEQEDAWAVSWGLRFAFGGLRVLVMSRKNKVRMVSHRSSIFLGYLLSSWVPTVLFFHVTMFLLYHLLYHSCSPGVTNLSLGAARKLLGSTIAADLPSLLMCNVTFC
uniref:Uncharacterized protein n=1 Tax=Cyanistes caeruleus TaxID=156563 RepID=A0A8C0UXM9_CYACU